MTLSHRSALLRSKRPRPWAAARTAAIAIEATTSTVIQRIRPT